MNKEEIVKQMFLETEEDIYNIGTLEDNKYTSCGRTKPHIRNGKKTYMGINAILEYLGLDNLVLNKQQKKEIQNEFHKLELKYNNENVDFCLKNDIEKNNVFNYNILETNKLLVAFTL